MAKVKMLSLDTSSSSTGYAYYEGYDLKAWGTIDLKKIKDKDERLKEMCLEIKRISEMFTPDVIVVELTSVARNVAAQRLLTMILGAIYFWCITNKCDFVSMRPSEWRSRTKRPTETLPRKREELKKWSIELVKEKFNIETTDDCSDSILLGEAYLSQFLN